MPNLTIYVDRDLEAAIRRYGVSVSTVCQHALRAELRKVEKATEAETLRRKGRAVTTGRANA